ncbi:MAG: DNA translocase FtsK 4TM domain-containing protein [Proteiniphilum sp.]|jgi:S-DNA-T family DNA segregation ATPase FtsK/SpoIIIE|nr:DNA translocase FtsK 4TM domain-containing protein [Proteiniphilum sp.]NCD14994.1 DNA translocase FtsK [Bacteroidia bacterium]MDD2726278.1 DNA translocase FtsK 4TM domain-containing protein [Proteiniphilum sp.]MDD3331611.1 DNA translocase FtsK 4TM domain-containing protein [Proteiniphilum sp.]MDD3978827.1 DNA translocase FtsK 4TM domain-containing protein [Proteiniphilum sp.]
MAKRKRKRTTTSRKKKINRFAFLSNERVHFLTGVVIAFIGIFLLLAITSFFFTGAADQSKVLNRSFFELIRAGNTGVDNWTGAGGAFMAELLVNGWFGIFSVLIPLFMIYIGLRIMKVSDFSFMKALFITTFGLVCGSIASAFILGRLFPNSHVNWGGAHGLQIEQILESSIGWPGVALLILLFLVILAVILRKSSIYTIQKSLVNSKPSFFRQEPEEETFEEDEETFEPITEKKPGLISSLFNRIKKRFHADEEEDNEPTTEDEITHDRNEDPAVTFTFSPETTGLQTPLQHSATQGDFEVIVPKEDEPAHPGELVSETPVKPEQEEQTGLQEDYDPRKDLSAFRFPTMNLLKVYNTADRAVDMNEQNENKEKIIHTLRNYGIEITSIKATVGPTITLYEIVPQAGVRISKIRNLEDDIALSLSALGIRIIAPMPGKGTIGIEVPNKEPQIVSMQSVISSRRFQECDYDLPVALGKTITNEVFIFDLTKMPHLLVAGATGQGKSVGLNAIITSLLYKKHPSEMKMVLIDPKMVEFNIYSTIEKHYLAKLPDEEKAIITDVTKVTQTLNSLTKEMDDRYELLMKAHVRTLKEYNDKFVKRRLNPEKGHRYMPYIVVVIDEFGDLIMTAGKEIEMPIARIAQKARAVGMHMVIATQRPTTNIITGTIKANFPARMAFRVTSQIDSRTILDMSGANQLIGRGDMLFSQGSTLIRIQCAFVDTPEVEEIAQYIGKQNGYDHAFALPEVITETETSPGAVDLNDRDPLFEEAARLIVVHQQGSTSLIQRKFSIGYNRAGRLMDQLEAAGIVGATQGSKPRDVFIADEYSLEKLINSLQ